MMLVVPGERRDRKLVIDIEPAKGWYIVYDEDDPEAGVFYGPKQDKRLAQAFIDGYYFALGEE